MATLNKSHTKLVSTSNDDVAAVPCRLHTARAAYGEAVLRQRIYLGSECRVLFFIRSHCDRGHRYGSPSCRDTARFQQRRVAGPPPACLIRGRTGRFIDHCPRSCRRR